MIYISGPMTGIDDYNRPAFYEAEYVLKKLGFKRIVNPARIRFIATWQDYMRCDISALMKCTSILMLPGWRRSKGARIEHQIAKALGFIIFYRLPKKSLAKLDEPC